MALDLDRIRAICFDVDGTLSDTDDLWVSKFSKIVKPVDFIFPRRDPGKFARWLIMVLESPGNLVYETLDRLHLDDNLAGLYNSLTQRNVGRKPKQFWMVPGVDNMLSEFHQRFPLAVVSARDEHSTHQFLNQFNLRPLFKSVVTSQTTNFTKPFPDPIHWAAGQMGVSAEECLMVGDTTVDIRAGKAAGSQTVGVLCGFGTERELRRAGADLILRNTHELLDVFNGNKNN